MKNSEAVVYNNKNVVIKELPKTGEDVQVFVRPSDSINILQDMDKAAYQIVGGDIVAKIPGGGTLTFVSMGLLAFSENSVSINFPTGSITIDDILSQIDDVKEAPIESVVTDDFVKLSDDFSDTKESDVAEENQNFSMILNDAQANPQTKLKNDDAPQQDTAKPAEEAPVNDNDAVYKPSDDNPVNINISDVNDAVSAGLKFTLTAFQTASLETKDAGGVISRVDGGGGSSYGSGVDTPEAQFQVETLDYSKNADGTNNTDAITIYSDAPKLFKTNPDDPNSASQLARDLSIRPEQPIGFGISAISISNLAEGFKIVGATFRNGAWDVPEAEYDANGNLTKEGFTVDINTGKARFTMTYPDDLTAGEEITAVINFTSTFDTANLLPGESVDSPDITSLSGQGRLSFVTNEIDWDSPTGYEGFIDDDDRVVLAINPNNNVVYTSHGDSTVYGGEGVDSVLGFEGNDTMLGAAGDDYLDGGAGDDILKGEKGDDTLLGQAGTNVLDGGDGLDTADYSYVTDNGGVQVDLSTNSGISVGVSDTLSNIERVVGSSYDDLITGDGLDNILEGASGVDTLYGGAGRDTLLGGNDTDSLDGGTGDDILYGGTGDDSLVGGAGNDTLEGQSGNDTLFFDEGNDTLDGGLGSDTMDFSTFVGGVDASIYQGDVSIANNTGTDVITNMEILSGSADADQLTGGSDNNTLLGQDGADTLRGNEGNDILDGGLGDDTLKGGADIDTLLGGAGDDLLFGEAGADKIDGGVGIDTANYADEGAIRTTLNEGTFTAVNVSGGDSDQIKNIENIKGSNTGNDSIRGDGITNVLDGQGGSDTIDGAGGDDTILGGAGNDTLSGGAGLDLIDGGSDDIDFGDTVDYTLEGRINVDLQNSGDTSVEINGSIEDTLRNIENIVGSQANDDTITGNDQKNILSGLGGNDTLTGEEGDDTLYGNDGVDTLFGNDGKDDLFGGAGDDTLDGGAGSDNLDGGSGIDFVSYANAATVMDIRLDTGIATGEGSVDGIVNVENIQGSAYADTIVGNDSVNVLAGGLSDDTLAGGLGADTLLGEGGADTLRGGEGVDQLYGEDNIGTLDSSLQDMASYSDVDNLTSTGITVNMTNDNTATAIVENDGYNNEDFLYDIENIQGTDYRDDITGDAGDNYLLGEGDNDTLVGGLGNDTLDGGAQDDILSGNGGDDTLLGGSGLDTADYTNTAAAIKVDLGNGSAINVTDDGDSGKDSLVDVENIIGSDIVGSSDTIVGDSANNLISGLSGDDTLKGGSGLDTLLGGDGNDTLSGGADADKLVGGTGDHDIVDYSDLVSNGVKVDLEAGTATGEGNDTLETIEDIRGSAQDDTLSGNSTVNTISGGAGNDILEGGEKALNSTDTDTLYGEDGDDTLRGDAGDDALFGGDGTTDTGSDTADYSTVTNGTATGIDADLSRATPQVTEDGYGTQDTLTGIENISGTQYSDLIKGSDDVAILNILSGNAGDDSFISSDGADSIIGGDDKDTIDYNAITNATNTGIVMDFDSIVAEKSITKTTTTGTYIDKVQSVERIIATEYADDIKGDAGANEYFGMSENDTLFGNSGDDTLYGDDLLNTLSGADTLDGGDGDDTLHGGKGEDTLVGGKGSDFIDGGEDFDVVDYAGNDTKISLSGNTVIESATETDTLQDIELILATNYEDTLIGDAGVNILDGRGANDTIIGQGGDDTLIGYSGSDTINGGEGSDLLIGGSNTNDKDTVGFNEFTGTTDVQNVVSVDLEGNSASVISIVRTDTTTTDTYSFDINGNTISYTAQSGDTGDIVISKLYDALVTASLTDIKQINDTSNTPNIDTYEQSHRLLIMDTSAGQTGFAITNVTNLTDTASGTASDGTSIDYLFDFDNIKGSDIQGANVGDTLTGNSDDNKIYAGEGDDTIFSTTGSDYLDGEGDTKLVNKDGGDWIDYSNQITTRVNLQLDAGNGDGTGVDNFTNTLINIENIRGTNAVAGDTITGDAGDNIIEGGDNNNNADTDANYETLSGGEGNDTIYGEGGRDKLYGNSGDDTLYGGDASDRLYGGAGDDKYIGGAGYDYVFYNGDDGTNDPISINFTNGGVVDAHGDTGLASDVYQEIEYIFGSDGGADYFKGDDNSTNTVAFNGLNGADTIIGGAGNENLIGEDGNDLITGGDGNDVLSGQNDNDTFFAQRGVDTINGGAGTDLIDFKDTSIMGTAGATAIEVDLRATFDINGTNYGTITDNGFGEASYILGVENLNATDGNDTFSGDANKNIVNLEGGDDRVFLSDGADTIYGGSNTDVATGGGDWVDATYATSGGAIYLDSGYESMGTLNGKVFEFEHIQGSTFGDYRLQGDTQDNTILGAGGNDTLVGLAGDDYLDGGADSDTVSYSELGAESTNKIVVHFDTPTQTIEDGFGTTDTVLNVETVVGSTNNDTFFGSTGIDSFLSGGGQDSFVGSLGDDYFSGNEGGVAAGLSDYSQLKDAAGSAISDAKLVLDIESQSAIVTTTSGDFTDTLVSVKNVIATNNDDTLTGSTADNSLYGLDGNDTFIATDGNDTYDGGDGLGDWADYSAATTQIKIDLDTGSTSKGINGSNDGLNSIENVATGSKNDKIVASTADNIIIANAGDDSITSNDGTNIFYGNDGIDTIAYDFEDTGRGVNVNLANSTATNAYNKTDTLSNFENVVGSANADTILGNDLNNSIIGGAGNDTITGGAGSDTLLGASGDDTFKFTNSEFGGDVEVNGGDDIDTIKITDTAAILDGDFANVAQVEVVDLTANADSVELGTNAQIAGIATVTAGAGNDTISYTDASSVSADNIDGGTGTDTLFANSAEAYDFSATTLTSIEELKFYQGAADQSITIDSDKASGISTFTGNSGQVNTLDVETTATTTDVDLSSGLSDIEKTIINVNLGISSKLTGNAATQDTITGNSGVDTLSGLGGDDILNAGAGADLILDGAGVDTIDAGEGDDRVEFSVANLDASNGADTVKGGADTDTLAITDAVTTANLTDTKLTNVSEFETIAFADVVNDITLNQDGVALLGGSNADTFNYAAADFTSSDTIDGSGGVDELKLTTASVKVLGDFVNISNTELLTTSDSNDDIDLRGGANGFETITLGQGDDTLTIDANNVWSGKTLDGGELGETNGDTLAIVGTVAVDLSATTVVNFENISSEDELSLTVKQINALGSVDVGTNTLNVVANDGDTSMSALNITASTIKFTSGMQNPTVVSDVHMNIDSSGSNQSITVGVNAATDKTSMEIKGSSAGGDVLNVALNAGEALTSGFKVDNQVETFNLSVADSSHTLDLANIATTTLLQTASSGSANTITIDNATKDVDASNLNSNETIELNATATAINIIGGASVSDTITLDTTADTFGTISQVEIINVQENNTLLSGKINTDVTNINITNGKTLALSAADLNANTLSIDDGVTNLSAGLVGNNDFSNITLTSSAELVLQVNADLNIASDGADNIAVVTEVDIANGTIFTLNADQTDNDLDVLGANAGSSLVIKSTSTDANNVFSGITKNGANAGTITYSVVNGVDKSGEGAGIFGAIDTLEVVSPNTLTVDTPQLTNITTLNGAGTLDVVGDGTVDLSGLGGSFTGEVLISDVAASETIIASKFDDVITIDAGTGDSIVAGAGDDTINLSQNTASIDGGADTDEIVLKADGLNFSSTTLTSIEKISFDTGAASSVTMNSNDVNTIVITGDASTNTINISDTGTIDLSAASLTNIEEIVFNDSAVNTITADLNGVNLLLGDSGDTLKIAIGSLSSADTITGGTGTDTIAFTNGGTVADAVFSNVTNVEAVEFSNSATDLTLGTQAGNIVTVTGGTSTSDVLTLNTGGSYTNISAIETLNIDKTIDLSGKITDVSTINVLSASGVLTLDATDFTSAIVLNNDKTLTINNATTTTITNADFTGSTGDTSINLNAGGTTIDFSGVTFAGNISLVGSSGDDVMSVDEGVALFDGSSGTDELIIVAGSSDSFSSSSIINFETIRVNENVNLSGAIDDDIVTSIDVATGKTLTLSAVDLSGKTIDLSGAGDTSFSAGAVGSNDFANISVSGGGKLSMAVSSALDISASGVDNIAVLTHVTLESGDTLTFDASQSDNALSIKGNNANSDVTIKAAAIDADNDFTNFVNTGSGNIILDVVENIDKSGEVAGILGDIDTITLSDNTKAITLDANQISSLTTLNGTGTLNVNAVNGSANLSALANGSFTGTINIIADATQADTITGSVFDDNILYSATAQADTLDGGAGTNTILVNADSDLTALTGANVTNITKLDVSGNFTATIDKDFADNSGVTRYTGASGTTDFIQVALGDGESIDLTAQTFADLKVKIDAASGGGNSSITGNDEVSNLITLADGTNTVSTFDSNDTITGGTGSDIINSAGGNDVINSGDGNDTITVGSGTDTVDAGANDDTIIIAKISLSSTDTLDGGAGNDILALTGGGSLDDSVFTNVLNIQTLKTDDADTTLDFSTNAGSISIVDASSMTSGSNLTLTTGSQLTKVTGGADDDTITYTDANLSSADILDGAGGVDTLIISDGASLSTSDLGTNITNIELLALSDNANTVDISASSIDSLEGGAVSDTITIAGDELSIKTNAGDDTVFISSVPTGLVDGGANDTDTLDVTGDLDLSGANIINFEKIVADGDITLSIAQADGVTMAIATGKTLTIKDTSSAGTLNTANITGGAMNIASLTAALIITGLATNLDASATSQDITINSVDGSKDVIGSSGTTTVEYAVNTTITGNLSAVDIIIADSGLSVDATLLDGKTQEFSTTDTITINATTTSTDHDFDNITQINTGDVLLNVDGSVDLTAQNISVVDKFDVANGVTLTLSASQLSGKTAIVGTGTIELTDTTLTAAQLNTFDTDSTALIDAASVTSVSGSSAALNSMYTSNGITTQGTEDVSFDDTATISAANAVDADTSGVITATIVSDTAANLTALTGTGNAYSLTISNTSVVASDLNALDGKTSVAVDATSATTITGTSGDDTIDLNAMDVTFATSLTVNSGAGNDTLTGTTGNETFEFANGDFDSNDTIDGLFGTDTLSITSAGTVTDADFTNVSNLEAVSLSGGVDTITVGTNADTALVNGALISGGDDADTYSVDFTNISQFVFDGGTTAGGGTNSDTTALTGSGSSTISDTQFDNIENLDITGLNTSDTLEITYSNLSNWAESGATDFTVSVNNGVTNITSGNIFKIDQNNDGVATDITTIGDYIITDPNATQDITLHVV